MPKAKLDFQNTFDPAHGFDFQIDRAYWLGQCAALIYPSTEAEKAADKKARDAKALEKALARPWWKPWRRNPPAADVERAKADARAAICKVAATEAARIEQDVRRWGFKRFQFYSGISTQCFLAASDALVVICFRGTEPNRFWDIYDDLMAIPLNAPGVPGMVHLGFWNALGQVWNFTDESYLLWPTKVQGERCEGLVELLADLRCKENAPLVWITGHSLGGALATTAAARLIAENVLTSDDIGGIYTFGQPRVGDEEFATEYAVGERHFCVVNENDVVTRVPPTSLRRAEQFAWMFIAAPEFHPDSGSVNLKFPYRDIGRIVYVSRAAGFDVDITGWDLATRRFAARLSSLLEERSLLRRLLPGIADHSMSRYNERLASDLGVADVGAPASALLPSDSSLGEIFKRGALLLSAGLGLLLGVLFGFAGLGVAPTANVLSAALATVLALILGVDDRYFTNQLGAAIGAFGFAWLIGAVAGSVVGSSLNINQM